MSSLLITPKALKQKVLKIWQHGDVHRAYLQKSDIFPISIPLKSITAKTLLAEYSNIQDLIIDLRQDSRQHGYQISDKSIEHRQLGSQHIPKLISFESEAIFLNYLKKNTEFKQFQQLSQQSLQQQPTLLNWLIRYPFKMMQYAEQWSQLLTICAYFKHHPQPQCYIRQLDIEAIDTKFIEQHKAILNELLTEILEPQHYDATITGLSHHGFERRYGLRYDPALIRLRILDPALYIQGLSDLTLTTDEFSALKLHINTVFIAENKITGLAFPNFPKAIIIFGLGYSVNLLKNSDCLMNKNIYYWGDIDTHGFAILDRLRHYYPNTQSMLMDTETLHKFKALSVQENAKTAEQKPLHHLTTAENTLYQSLQVSLIRLEQERISFSHLENTLTQLTD